MCAQNAPKWTLERDRHSRHCCHTCCSLPGGCTGLRFAILPHPELNKLEICPAGDCGTDLCTNELDGSRHHKHACMPAAARSPNKHETRSTFGRHLPPFSDPRMGFDFSSRNAGARMETECSVCPGLEMSFLTCRKSSSPSRPTVPLHFGALFLDPKTDPESGPLSGPACLCYNGRGSNLGPQIGPRKGTAILALSDKKNRRLWRRLLLASSAPRVRTRTPANSQFPPEARCLRNRNRP